MVLMFMKAGSLVALIVSSGGVTIRNRQQPELIELGQLDHVPFGHHLRVRSAGAAGLFSYPLTAHVNENPTAPLVRLSN
jgi:hypothetical protein